MSKLSIVISLGATIALFVTAVVALRLTGWRHAIEAFARMLRREDDHPHFELLMQ